ncbi:cellulose binding domain-containing protein [Actinocorallia populi]|uniref:cellulose binding domain-containing protein n=1 Tax=Actinocorallia populi TaxID=2079200 RepID=UPI0013008CF1|nr:cellulose binding domain-containing protein [Actinocorallia populi]
MGRHTKFWDRASGQEAPSDGAPPVAAPQRLAWLGRTPLMPLLAGVVAVGVIAAAFSTRQISLNFAGGAPSGQDSAACAGCDGLADLREEGSGQPETAGPQVVAGPSEASLPRQSTRTVSQRPLRVEIRLGEMISGGFTAVAVVRNTSRTAKDWKLSFRIPNAVIVAAEGAGLRTTSKNGGTTWLDGLGALEGRQSVKVTFTAEGAWSKPSVCKVNGYDCS